MRSGSAGLLAEVAGTKVTERQRLEVGRFL